MMARKILLVALLLGLLLVSAPLAEGRRRRRRHRKPKLTEEQREALEEIKGALDACEEQMEALCPRPEGEGHDDKDDAPEAHRRLDRDEDEGEDEDEDEDEDHRAPPCLVALCLSDHADSLTGECATAWADVSSDSKDVAMEPCKARLTPAANFKRACGGDVERECSGEGARDDVATCLTGLDDSDALSEECAAFLGEDATDMLNELAYDIAHRDGDEGEYEGEDDNGVAPPFSTSEFEAIDDLEFEDDDEHNGPPLLMIAGAAVAAIAVLALIVVGIVIVKRRRSRRAAAFSAAAGVSPNRGKALRRANSVESQGSQVTLVQVKPQFESATPPATSGVQLV